MDFSFLVLFYSFLIIVFGLSVWAYIKGKFSLSIACIVLGGVLLRIIISSDMHLHAWDERFHALVAKNLMDHPFLPTLYDTPVLEYDSTNWVANHIWLHKQPFPLWSMSASMYLFGVNEWALRLPSILLSSVSIWVIYDFAKRLIGERVGIVAAFLLAIQGLVLEIGSGRVATDHIDLFFMALILIASYFALRFAQGGKVFYNVLCGLFIGFAILTKWLPALIVVPIWISLVVYYRRFSISQAIVHLIVFLIICTAVAVPWQWYIHANFPIEASWEKAHNWKHLVETLDERGGSFLYFFDQMRMSFGELVYIPLIWFVYILIKKKLNWKYLLLAGWLFVPYLFFSISKTKMQGYVLFAAPALLIICAYFWVYLKFNWRKLKLKPFFFIVLVALIVLPIRFTIERLKPFENRNDWNPKWAQDLRDFNERTKNEEKVLLFNVNNPVEAMFYTNATAYKDVPTDHVLDSLLAESYQIFVNHWTRTGEVEGIQSIHLDQPTY